MRHRDHEDGATDSVGELLMHAARRLRRRWSLVLRPWDIPPHQARALGRLCRRATPPRLSELADELRIAPRSATEVVDGLEARDLVVRRPDPDDRRAVVVHVTERGHALQDELAAARAADVEAFFADLPDEDRATLARILRQLLEPEGPTAR